jgi:hypothetical protein
VRLARRREILLDPDMQLLLPAAKPDPATRAKHVRQVFAKQRHARAPVAV